MNLSLRIALPLCAAVLGTALLAPSQAGAGPIELSVQPLTAEINRGEPITVQIVIEGLDPEHLGGFDLDLSFDPAALQYQSYSLGTALVDPVFGHFDLSDVTASATGVLRLGETATLLDLDDQPTDFVLASVSFVGLGPGTSPLDLSVFELIDGQAQLLTAAGIADGSITVPGPGTLWLLAPAALGLLVRRRLVR